MKIEVHHWMAKRPPCDGAVKDIEGNYSVEIRNLSDLKGIVSKYDVMLRELDNEIVMYVDHKGKRFRQR